MSSQFRSPDEQGGAGDGSPWAVRRLVSKYAEPGRTPHSMACIGKPILLLSARLALLCPIECPGELLPRLVDLVKELRDKNVGVISGFEAPLDGELFDILLAGRVPIVWCPARSIETMPLSVAQKQAIADERLCILSLFAPEQDCVTYEQVAERNEIIQTFCERAFIAYAPFTGRAESFCEYALSLGKTVYTFEGEHTENLRALGATAVQPGNFPTDWLPGRSDTTA